MLKKEKTMSYSDFWNTNYSRQTIIDSFLSDDVTVPVKKERDLVKQVNDELIERVIGQQVLYYPISMEHTNFHPTYGEAIEKTFLPPVRVYALVEWEGIQTQFMLETSFYMEIFILRL